MYQAKLSEKLDNISSYPRVSRQCFGLLEVSWSDVEELEQLCEKNPLQSFFLLLQMVSQSAHGLVTLSDLPCVGFSGLRDVILDKALV